MLVSTRPLLNLILKPSEPPSPSGGDTSQLVVRWDEFFIRVLRCGEELLAIPVVRGTKTKARPSSTAQLAGGGRRTEPICCQAETFPGADYTTTVEAATEANAGPPAARFRFCPAGRRLFQLRAAQSRASLDQEGQRLISCYDDLRVFGFEFPLPRRPHIT